MSLHRFDLEDPAKEARDRLEADSLHPTTIAQELAAWAAIALGSGCVIAVVLALAGYFVGGM